VVLANTLESAEARTILDALDHLRTHTFASLSRHPNYRLYWFGALGSNIGTWVQMVAQGWLVYQLTGSALYLGAVGFASSIPTLFLSLFGGVLADRFERRRLMIFTQTGSMILAFVLAYLTVTGVVAVWHVATIAFLNGVVNSLNAPVRQTIISDLVTKEDLSNAIAVNSAQFQTSRMLGPAIAGVLIAAFGAGWCFLINGLSFLIVIGALLAMKLAPLPPRQHRSSLLGNVMGGIRYVRGEPVIMMLVGLAAIPSLFAMPYQAMMPAFASAVLGVGADGLGLLMSASGLGALVGALGVASLPKRTPRGRLMVLALLTLGVTLAAFAGSRTLGVASVMLVGVGISSMAYNALNQTYLQTLASDEMRGRVMSLLTLTTFGFQPFGQLEMGSVAELAGPSTAVGLGGLVCACLAVVTLVRRSAVARLA
jgi:MFS family permease